MTVELQPAKLQAALIKVTETLAHELARPTAGAPDWSEFEWDVGRAAAAIHGASPLLAATLPWRGPVGWVRFLEQQRAHTAARHLRIEELLKSIDQGARRAGIPMLALKGVALHLAGVYRPGDRPMADIDLLVRPSDSRETIALLRSLGYLETPFAVRDREFGPGKRQVPSELGEHANNDVKIELHERIREALPFRETDITEVVFSNSRPPGLNPYPSNASLMTHLLLHASGNMVTRSVRLIQLHDIAMLSLKMSEHNWQEVLHHGGADRLWWAFPPLRLVSRYYTAHIPPAALAESFAQCPALLRRVSTRRNLSAVSFSHLWVEAFPGIEWSRSIAEALKYAAGRICPTAEHVANRKRAAAADVSATQTQWAKLPQSRRILRWILTQPVRARTMLAVRTALSNAQMTIAQ